MASVNVPVVSRADYAFDAAAPDGSLASSEEARLDGWFRSLQLGYGDSIYVDGPYSDGARADVARVAGRYGLLVSNGAPVTAGAVAAGLGPRGRQPHPRQRSELPELVGPVAAQSSRTRRCRTSAAR